VNNLGRWKKCGTPAIVEQNNAQVNFYYCRLAAEVYRKAFSVVPYLNPSPHQRRIFTFCHFLEILFCEKGLYNPKPN
jgi:hypothetical protein